MPPSGPVAWVLWRGLIEGLIEGCESFTESAWFLGVIGKWLVPYGDHTIGETEN